MVAEEPVVIHIEPDSEIARHLASAGSRPVILEIDGVRLRFRSERPRLTISDYPGQHHDPERAIAGMRAAAGSWSDIDGEELKEYIYRARDEGTRPIDRP
jgi:hypothetical protein